MEVKILQQIDGAKAAEGVTVIIDVFRAFSVEAYLIRCGAKYVIPVGEVDLARRFKEKHPDALLCGERGGVKIEGFDFGNSPAEIEELDLRGKTVIHTTSAGTQGVANATHATEIIGGSLVCAKAIADYIKGKKPEKVSLVCMGLSGKRPTDEDTLAAEYIKSLIEGKSFPNLFERIEGLKLTDGAKFFKPDLCKVFPPRDFELCTRVNCFPYIVRLREGGPEGLSYMERVDVQGAPMPKLIGDETKVRENSFISEYTRNEVSLMPPSAKAEITYKRHVEGVGNYDAAIVLGSESAYIESRAAAAAKLYHDGRCNFFITTGGVFRETPYGFISEADALLRYMINAGVPENLIVTETRAATTNENMTFSRAIIGEKCKKATPKIAIVTSYYHVFRATELAKAYIKDAEISGIKADFPEDNPEEFENNPALFEAVTKSCVCLSAYVKCALIPDFKVLELD